VAVTALTGRVCFAAAAKPRIEQLSEDMARVGAVDAPFGNAALDLTYMEAAIAGRTALNSTSMHPKVREEVLRRQLPSESASVTRSARRSDHLHGHHRGNEPTHSEPIDGASFSATQRKSALDQLSETRRSLLRLCPAALGMCPIVKQVRASAPAALSRAHLIHPCRRCNCACCFALRRSTSSRAQVTQFRLCGCSCDGFRRERPKTAASV
jgi:hypothetical protein